MNLILYQLERADYASDEEFSLQTKAAIQHFLIPQVEALGITEELARLPGYWEAQGYEVHWRAAIGYPLAEVYRIRGQELLEVVYDGDQVRIYANHPALPAMASEGVPVVPWGARPADQPESPAPGPYRPPGPAPRHEGDLLAYVGAQLDAGVLVVTVHLDPNLAGTFLPPAPNAPDAYGHACDAEGRIYALGPDWLQAWHTFQTTRRLNYAISSPVENPTHGITTFRIGPAVPEADG